MRYSNADDVCERGSRTAFTGCAVANGAGQMIAERTIPTLAHEGAESVLNRIAATVNDLASTAGERVLALGV